MIRKEGFREDLGIKGGLNRPGGIHIEKEIFLGEYLGIEFAGNQHGLSWTYDIVICLHVMKLNEIIIIICSRLHLVSSPAEKLRKRYRIFYPFHS